MESSTKFNQSKIGQRIAILLFAAAIIPVLMTILLSNHQRTTLSNKYEHTELIRDSENYALHVFSNLTHASEKFEQFSKLVLSANFDQSSIEMLRRPIFVSFAQIKVNGVVTRKYGNTNHLIHALPRIINMALDRPAQQGSPHLIVVAVENSDKFALYLAKIYDKSEQFDGLFVAELNPEFVWGNKEYLPLNQNTCVYRVAGDSYTTLFCSRHVQPFVKNGNPANVGSWELFLAAAFNESPWVFQISRTVPIELSQTGIIKDANYIWIAILTMLLIGLLSLIHMRKTLVPLEQLIEATRKIARGNFSEVEVIGNSEFSELAKAMNTMSTHIEKQFDTLQSLSALDREIITNLDMESLIERIINRMQKLMPENSFYIFRIREIEDAEVFCNVDIVNKSSLRSTRLSIPKGEIESIKSYNQEYLIQCSVESSMVHERFAAELGDNYLLTLPILWQGEIYAFLTIGSKTSPVNQDSLNYSEFKELCSRIGIVIASHEREELLLTQAQYDTLTGLPNRILMQDRINQAIEHSIRTEKPFWIMFLDLDYFKYINDSMGHAAGDELLVQISKRLQSTLRDTDTVARFGGDEFIIVLQSDTDDNQKLSIANRLIESITEPIWINQQEVLITSSMGISVYPTDGTNADALIKHADTAMYRAKEQGRNNLQFFTASMNEKAEKRMKMETHLRRALDRNEFILLYQPKVNLISGEIIGVEALIRWNSPEMGTVSPIKFIDLAEETGLIIPIGEWVLRTACQQAASWTEMGLVKLQMSVNISMRQFKKNDLVDSIKNILAESGIAPRQLELELTESLLLDDQKNVVETLHKLKALGIKLAIDDFGTGYSSLSYLNHLPIDTLKIDKCFVDEIKPELEKSPIIDTIIALANNLELEVVAEGVESAEQALYLANHGCNLIQGYYYSKPETAETIENLMLSKKNPLLKNVKSTKNPEKTILY